MRKPSFIAPALICLIAIFLPGCKTPNFTIKEKTFRYKDLKEFYPLVCNYLVDYLYLDNDTTKLVLSPNRSVDAFCYNCTDMKSCLDQMSKNFVRIREMGFNTIRLFGSNPYYYCKQGEFEAWRIRAWDHAKTLKNGCDKSTLNNYHDYFSARLVSSSPMTGKIFALVDSVISRAANAGLYVILVSGCGSGDYSLNYPRRYAEYLECLANHIHTAAPEIVREKLLAYDLDNEPSMSWNPATMWPQDTVGHSKKDVYNNVQLFTKNVRKSDPGRLVTLGGRSFNEVFEYDPAILPIDFYSAHFYPVDKSYDANPFRDMMYRVQGHFVWLSEILDIPFIIGETGFRSQPGGNGPDGTNDEQKRYAEITLDMTRHYGGSGYSWWNFQDYNWGKHDGYFGLTYWDSKSQSVAEKPVAGVFRKYDPNLPFPAFAKPENYYDPYNHRKFNTGRNYLSGRVQDENGRPLKNALILGWTPVDTAANGSKQYEPHYTFSDANGEFTIIPYDYDPVTPPNTETVVEIRVTAPGYSRFTSGWHSDNTGVPPDKIKVITLEKLRF